MSTAVWIARDDDALVVTTPEGSGKVKRLRNSPRVELSPCGRLGHVKEGVEPVAGVAQILADQGSRERVTEIISKKYGLEYRVVMGIERRSRSGQSNRVILRITPA